MQAHLAQYNKRFIPLQLATNGPLILGIATLKGPLEAVAHERKRESKGEQPSLSVVTSEFQANNCTGTVAAETSADRQKR